MTTHSKKPSIYLPESAWAPEGNIEGVSDTILQRVCGGKLIKADALTGNGWLRMLAVECDEDMRERAIEQMSREMTWKVSEPTTIIIPGSTPKAAPKPPQWIDDQAEILTRLESEEVGSEEFEKAVLVAEITDFIDDKVKRLLDSLGQFIGNHRFATDEDTLILLGCAIRKYAMNMDASHFNTYTKWLEPTETEFLDSRIELELVKGVNWRLSYEPFSAGGNSIDDLVNMVDEVCIQYSSQRLLLQKNFASIAIQASNAIILLHLHLGDGDKAKEMLERSKSLKPSWVAEMIVDQLDETYGFLAEHSPEASAKLQELLKA